MVRVSRKQNGGHTRSTNVLLTLDYCLPSPSLLLTSLVSSLLYLTSAGAESEREKKKKSEHASSFVLPGASADRTRRPHPSHPSPRPSLCHISSGFPRRRGLADTRPSAPNEEGGLVAVGLPAGVRARALAVGVGRQRRAVPGHPSGQVHRRRLPPPSPHLTGTS